MIRKVNTGFMVKMWKLYIYVVGHAMKERKRSYRGTLKHRLRLIRLEKLHQGGGCEICGKYLTAQTSELHHIKPRSLYPELKGARDNLMLICHECHVELHKEVQRKAYELLDPHNPKPSNED